MLYAEIEKEPENAETEEKKEDNRSEKDERDESGYAGTGDDHDFTDPTPFMKTKLGSPSPPSCSSIDDLHEPSPGYYKAIQREEVGDVGYCKILSQESRKKKQKGSKKALFYSIDVIIFSGGNFYKFTSSLLKHDKFYPGIAISILPALSRLQN